MNEKDTYRYYFKVDNKIVHCGITKDPERREQEHQLENPEGHFKLVGRCTTEETAREWEAKEWFRKGGHQ